MKWYEKVDYKNPIHKVIADEGGQVVVLPEAYEVSEMKVNDTKKILVPVHFLNEILQAYRDKSAALAEAEKVMSSVAKYQEKRRAK